MTTSPGRKHAGPGPASDQPPVPEPTFAERARTLVYLGRVGSLSTLSRKQPGFPFGSVMPYALDGHGRPIFLISTMAMHTQNLQADARASLLVTQEDTDGDGLNGRRSMNLSAYWKPSLLLLAFAAVGTASSPAPVSADTAAIAKTIEADVAQLVAGLNAHDAVKTTAFDAPNIISMECGSPSTIGIEADQEGFKMGFAHDPVGSA